MNLRLLLIDIDGLRADVFQESLKEEAIPNLALFLGGSSLANGIIIPAIAPAPSITFTSQASLFSGAHPSQHGIPGNQFFDRFGINNQGKPRHYAFDVGDTLAGDDAVKVFSHGLASKCLKIPTVYERFHDFGWKSVVAGNMYAAGAESWLKPSIMDLARLTKGSGLFGMEGAEFDQKMVEKAIDYINATGLPEVLTVYFMGLDHESHHHGPGSQKKYLTDIIDPMVGELWDSIKNLDPEVSPLIAIFSDHGQIEVVKDDRHSIRLAFPFEREMGNLFDALGLDVHDFPGEDPNCDAVVCSNGGLAHVYLRNQGGEWTEVPEFERDVYEVGRAFWEAHQSGRYAPEIHDALDGVFLRNVSVNGWDAPYLALAPGGGIVPLEEWFFPYVQTGMRAHYIDPVHRLNNLCSAMVGDILLLSNYKDGYYFASPLSGVHGGLHPDDSSATLALGFMNSHEDIVSGKKDTVIKALDRRCKAEGGRKPSTADLLTCVLPVLEVD